MRAMAKRTGVRWLLLLGLSLLVVAAILIYDQLSRSTAPPAAEGLVGGVTARRAFEPASEAAEQWQEDARLANISGHWSGARMERGNEITWAFQFFSPATQRLALVTVADGAARVMRENLSPYKVPTFSSEEWRVDSDQALQAWWDSGGNTMETRHPDMELAMRLHVPDEGGDDPVWTVVGLTSSPEWTFIVVMNANTGALRQP